MRETSTKNRFIGGRSNKGASELNDSAPTAVEQTPFEIRALYAARQQCLDRKISTKPAESKPVYFSTFPLLSLRRVGAPVVIEEGFNIAPAAPVADQQGIHVGAGERGRPGAPETVKAEVVPADLVGFVLEAIGGVLDPPPERARRRDLDERRAGAGVADVVDRPDGRREVSRDGRLPVLVSLSMPHSQHGPGVGIHDVLRCDVEDLVAPEPAASAEREGDPLLGVFGGVEEVLYFGLTEPDLHVVALGMGFEIHVRVACNPDGHAGCKVVFGGVGGVIRAGSVRLSVCFRTLIG